MKMLRGILKLQHSTNKFRFNKRRLFPISRSYSDDKDVTVISEPKRSKLPAGINDKTEEKKIISKIHADYKKEILVKLENKNNDSLGDVKSEKSELEDKYATRFESRLDHYRRSGFIAKPTLINVPIEPKLNPVIDKAIEIIKGKIIFVAPL